MVAAVAGLGLLAGCATPPSDDPDALAAFEEANDPLEPMNRYFFELNYAADELLFKPLAGWYYVALPNFAQDGVRNALRNLRSPIVLANDLFQGETERAGITVGRFLVNSTLGLAGLFDVASEMGLEYHDEDFGQTMAVHGVGEGPYLVLPLLGPSNPRDASGRVVDMLFDPLTYIGIFGGVDNIGLGAAVLEGVDTRARNLKTLDEVRKGSLDYYATLRSLYRQRRIDEINNGRVPPEGVGPSFEVFPEDETSERPAPPQVSATVPAAASPAYVTAPVVDAPTPAAGPRLASSSPFIKEPTGPIPAALDP
jgi:phospholipid-binding lipoprotein MlaA